MLTIKELSQLTNKPVNTIAYRIKNDKRFREMFWVREETIVKTKKGYYKRQLWLCDEGNISRILEVMNERKEYKKLNAHWTSTAIDCYERGMVCSGCDLKQYCSQEGYPMKKKVLEFVRLYGEPR